MAMNIDMLRSLDTSKSYYIANSTGEIKEAVTQFNTLSGYMDELKETVEKALGRKTFTPIRFEDAKRANNDEFYAGDILDDVLKESTDFVEEKRQQFLGGIVVTLQYRRGRDDMVLFAPVTDPDAELPAETLRSALALACHGEGTHGNFLGLFGETLLLSAVLPLEGLDADTLAARILGFSDVALDVRDALTSPAASAPSDSTPDAPVPSPLASLPPIPGPFIGFIA